jgi:prepilin-type N-terminal cleavage/methylation domain-containing protein
MINGIRRVNDPSIAPQGKHAEKVRKHDEKAWNQIKSKAGFTFLEVLISVVILGLIVSPFWGVRHQRPVYDACSENHRRDLSGGTEIGGSGGAGLRDAGDDSV